MSISKKTKIIATIGPASDKADQIKKLILSGVDIFRFNTKHSTLEWHNQRIKRVRKVAGETKKTVGIMIDLQGKEVNFPKTKTDFSSLVKKDIEALNYAVKNKVDFIALSFVNCKKDISILKREMKKRKINALIVSKIEGQGALDNVDEIIENSNAIMVARGDLGIETPIQELAYWQKKIIDKSRKKGIPVIVATEMLHSMVNNPRPSRAEATDVANAVFDGADTLMLSEETAIGKYPFKTVEMMVKIIKFNEKKSTFLNLERPCHNLTEFVIGAFARELLKRELGIKTAVVFTESGYTARVLSSFRPQINIVALTNNKEVVNQLSLSYGAISFYNPVGFNNFELPKEIARELKRKKIVSKNETIAIFHGRDKKKPNLLNLFSLNKIE